jgi:hypothetical protein
MKRIAFAVTLTLLSTTLFAQKAAPVEVKVDQVNDRRTNGSFSQLMIQLELPKVQSQDVQATRVLVAAASDDSGRSLINPEAGEPMLEQNYRRAGAESKPATVSITLLNPDRKAKAVKEVRGEIELFMPSKDPSSVAEIAKFTSFAGKPLAHKSLKANGIEMALLSNAQIEAERKKILDAKRKEFAEMGWEGENLDNAVNNYKDSTLPVDENELLMRIKDPNKRIQDIAYVDAAGEVKQVSTRDDEGFVYLSTWHGKPEADWKLRVSMVTPKNLVRYPFTLRDVALP